MLANMFLGPRLFILSSCAMGMRIFSPISPISGDEGNSLSEFEVLSVELSLVISKIFLRIYLVPMLMWDSKMSEAECVKRRELFFF